MSTPEPVFLNGIWCEADASSYFQEENPATREMLAPRYPVSTWSDCEVALESAAEAFEEMRSLSGEDIAAFLEFYADELEARADELVATAHAETALPVSPRLADVELPRTTGQLRQAADAARSGQWRQPTVDTANNLRSAYAPLGPVCVFGPNNFPFAFNSVAGGDFAAALAAGNPVIAKANSSHPGTTKLLAEAAQAALSGSALPAAAVQMIYRTGHRDGERLVSHPAVGATGYTGSRSAGLKLKAAADAAGKPIYLELSSLNPVVILPGALRERGAELVEEFAGSCLMGTGQFCTNPGLVLLLAGEESDQFIAGSVEAFEKAPAGTLLSDAVRRSLHHSHEQLAGEAGAEVLCGTGEGKGEGHCVANTLFKVSGEQFLANPEALQTEAFGNSSLFVVAEDEAEAREVLASLEGNLTGGFYCADDGSDGESLAELEPVLRRKVGRLLHNKMPTGVAVSPAMNHGGPYPATGHPGFTAVGIPASLLRFAALHSYDNVPDAYLPEILRDDYEGPAQRFVDGAWR